MLDGIEVLNKIAETTIPSWYDTGVIIIMALAVIAGIIWAIIEKEGFCFGICLLLGLLVLILFTIIVPDDVPTGKYTYQVTIDDSVNLKEFNDKYKITKQEGEIYYIREK